MEIAHVCHGELGGMTSKITLQAKKLAAGIITAQSPPLEEEEEETREC